MNENYNISSSPHIRSKATTGNIMLYVLIALIPTTGFGIYNFGISALVVVAVTTASAVLTEYIYEKLMGKKVTIKDLSAAVTGLLLALNLPPTTPWWMCVLGSVFAILIVKQLFGGLGQNFMNPALAARCFLLISFTGRMTTFVYDGVSGATPLAQLKAGESVNTFDMLIGNTAGTIGETYRLYHCTSWRRRTYAWSMVYGDRLCNFSDYKNWTDCIWNVPRYINRIVPSVWWFRRRSILCDHYQQSSCSVD